MKIQPSSNLAQIEHGSVDRLEMEIKSTDLPQLKVDARVLESALRCLMPNGNLHVLFCDNQFNDESINELISTLKLSGFINCNRNHVGNTVSVSGQKPDYDIGATVKLSLKKISLRQPKSTQIYDENTLIDENTLLTADDYKKPTFVDVDSADNCSTKKKACKNCTCGRAEMENERENTVQLIDIVASDEAVAPLPKSSCGNCYLGDAFRCSGCPYKGMPAFKAGETVSLELQDDV